MSRKVLSLRQQVEEAFEQSEDSRKEEDKQIHEILSEEEQEKEAESRESEPIAEEEADNESKKEELDDEPRAIANWSEEDKKIFRSMDDSGRKFLLKRHNELEKDYTRKRQADSEALKLAESYKQLIEPHKEYFRNLGMEPAQALNMLANAERKLRFGTAQEKLDTFNYLARNYDVLRDAAGTQQQIDPNLKPIFDEISQTKAELARIKQERQQTENDYLNHVIQEFKTAKDKNGNLKYPHFEDVRSDMGDLIRMKKAESLEDAYEQAIFLNRDLREKHIMEYTKSSKRLEEDQRRDVASKKASFNVKSRSSSESVEIRKKESLRQTLAKVFEAQHNARF
jgi:hypothetical protein